MTDTVTQTKTCTKCKEDKPIEAFHRNGKYRQSRCTVCSKEVTADWRKHNRQRTQELYEEWCKRNPEANAVRCAKYYTRKKLARARQLGITSGV